MVRYIVNALAEKPLKASNVFFGGGGNLLHYAARQGRRAVMRELLRHHQADSLLQDSDPSGDKPLDTAVMEGHEAVTKEILRTVEGRRQFRTIFRAIEAKRVSIVKLLLDNGWEAGYRDGDANTPLHKATESRQTEIVKLLLERSNTSLLNERNGAGDTPLHIAVSKKDRDIVKRLLDSGADPNVRNPTSWLSPLHLLCKSGGENAEEILKEFAPTEGGASKTEGKHRERQTLVCRRPTVRRRFTTPST
jgi:ankyrin repeat protein